MIPVHEEYEGLRLNLAEMRRRRQSKEDKRLASMGFSVVESKTEHVWQISMHGLRS